MLRHYLKIALRNLLKYKVQSIINIIGLALGITFFSYGYHWLNYETSFDSFYPQAKNTYKVYLTEKLSGKKEPLTPYCLHTALKKDFAEIKSAVYNNPWRQGGYTCNEKYYDDPYFLSVDRDFLHVFPQQVLYGKSTDLLATGEEIIITESFARKCWGVPEKAVGQTVSNPQRGTFTVTSVIKDFPANTTLPADGCCLDTRSEGFYSRMPVNMQWKIANYDTYLVLHSAIDPEAFAKKLRMYAIDRGLNPDIYLHITPLTSVKHTLGLFRQENSFSISYIRTFAVAGLLLLICAFFNFLNLIFNHFFQRAKEVKLRDSLGAGRKRLLVQLLVEISLQVFVALFLSVSLLELTMAAFQQQFETHVDRSDLLVEFAVISLLSWLVLLLVSAIPLSRFIRTSSCRYASAAGSHVSQARFRKVSIGIQLLISVFFIFSASSLFRQVSYMNNTDWGFNKDNLLQITMDAWNREDISHEIATLPTVKAFISTSLFSIYNESQNGTTNVEWEGKNAASRPEFQLMDVGSNFAEGMEVPVVQGRFFNDEEGGEAAAGTHVVVNEEAARVIGGNVIGKKLRVESNRISSKEGRGYDELEIIGVIKDFHCLSLRNPIVPAIIKRNTQEWSGYYNYIRIIPGTERTTINAIREVLKKHASPKDGNVKIITMQQLIEDLNKSEKATVRLFSLLALLCILISAFGIYSISLSNMERRKKEIAVRKVMGASTGQIIGMFLKEYTWTVFIANLLACPFSVLFISRWLENYPFHIHLGAKEFIGVFILSAILVILTVLWQVIKAAGKNPAEVVKSE